MCVSIEGREGGRSKFSEVKTITVNIVKLIGKEIKLFDVSEAASILRFSRLIYSGTWK